MKEKSLTFPLFLEFIELKTKITWFFPLFTAILLYYYRNSYINITNTILFVIASLCVDLSTTAINNVMDYKKAVDDHYKYQENIIGRNRLNIHVLERIIYALLIFAFILSSILVIRTDLLLFPMGVICSAIAIFYTYGPFPISRLPLGEIFSGLTEGFGIFFLTLFVQEPSTLIMSHFSFKAMHVVVKLPEVISVFLLSIPFVCMTANIMLANNICDLEQDIRNKRFTLVYYLGEKNLYYY